MSTADPTGELAIAAVVGLVERAEKLGAADPGDAAYWLTCMREQLGGAQKRRYARALALDIKTHCGIPDLALDALQVAEGIAP